MTGHEQREHDRRLTNLEEDHTALAATVEKDHTQGQENAVTHAHDCQQDIAATEKRLTQIEHKLNILIQTVHNNTDTIEALVNDAIKQNQTT